MTEDRDIVVFTDDQGNDFTMEVTDYFFYEGEEYAVLVDPDELDCCCECEECEDEECDCEECEECDCEECGHDHTVNAVIMKIVQLDDGMEEFVPVEDESLMEKLIEVATTRIDMDALQDEDEVDDEE